MRIQPDRYVCVSKRERERERERERQTDRQTDKQTGRQTDRKTDRQAETDFWRVDHNNRSTASRCFRLTQLSFKLKTT